MGVREEQREKRREDILRAGLDLFVHKGYVATKVKDIAESVGMSTGLLFHYFDSKEALYEALIELGIAGPMSTMAQDEGEPLAFFEKAAEQIIRYIADEPFAAKMFVLMAQARYNDAAPQRVKDLLAGFDIYTPTAALIRKGQEQRTIREGDTMALGIAYWCAIQGIAEEYALDSHYPLPESRWIVDIIRRREP